MSQAIPPAVAADDREATYASIRDLKPAYGKHQIRSTTLSNIHSFSCFLLDAVRSFLAQK